MAAEHNLLPIRLRMSSWDRLCVRSMHVEWEVGTGERQSWNSWEDACQNSWYEAEVILPSSATDISVRFQAGGVLNWQDVCKVDRHDNCVWVLTDGTHYPEEVFWFRTQGITALESIDAVFQLAGPKAACYVRCAQNLASQGALAEWEGESRPEAAALPRTLIAAERARGRHTGDPGLFQVSTARRLCAATQELIEVHRETLDGLRELDEWCSLHWYGVNAANSMSAVLSSVAAPFVFVFPPVGLGLGAGAAAIGVLTYAGDSVGDASNFKAISDLISADTWNTCVHAELTKEWLQACDLHGQTCAVTTDPATLEDTFSTGARVARLAAGTAEIASGATNLANTARATMPAVVAARVASRVLTITGAVVSTGIAVHGWTRSNVSQQLVRRKIDELTEKIVRLQCLAFLLDGNFECPICLEPIAVTDPIRRCRPNSHPFHAACFSTWAQIDPTCPVCRQGIDLNVTQESFEELSRLVV
eukprot:TRINITY_DN64988_c0_g1_i1.p1 TRINITY_DN64988_c0_g1~~TRINITY_DN64988_c0_g1_i1.p1  ORF type:complete len:477 (+),score=53.80 TRINITY_DN64988_c0_g1_i1:61-1491(+)